MPFVLIAPNEPMVPAVYYHFVGKRNALYASIVQWKNFALDVFSLMYKRSWKDLMTLLPQTKDQINLLCNIPSLVKTFPRSHPEI